MPIIKKFISDFKNFNPIRKIKTIIIIIFVITAQASSILCVIGVIDFSQLLSNINIPSGYIYLDIDIYSPETMTVQIPYEISNPGIYDLADIKVNVDIRINYINESNHANITSPIFSKTSFMGQCKALQVKTGFFEGGFSDFLIPPLADFHDNFDELEMVYFLLDLQFHAKYFLGLIDFQFCEYNLNLFSF